MIGSPADCRDVTGEGGGPPEGGRGGDGGRREKWIRAGAVAGVALSLFFSFMWTAAVIVNGHWTLGEDTLSELGGGGPSGWIFNSAVIIAGLLGLLFTQGLWNRLRQFTLSWVGCFILANATVDLMLVGVYPIDTAPHGVVSWYFFVTAMIAALLLLMPIRKWVGAKGAPFVLTVAILVISIACVILTPIPFAEAVAVSSLMAWIFVLGIWMLRERMR